ncbi:MAG: iron-containing alcohol dehydrogenase [Pseudomonadota bacterium]
MDTSAIIGRVQSPRIIRIGGGVSAELAEVLKQLGLSHPLIVSDKNLKSLGHVGKITATLDQNGVPWCLFDDVVEDPTDTCVDAGLAALAKSQYDCIIGFGGGSPMDTAKAISFMAANGGHVRDYKAPAQVDKCGVPVILIPTTGGTGSELTRWCVITDTELTEKYNISGLACVATAALIDWQFTVTKPWRITADTAVDSLTHAIEAYVSRKAFPYTDGFALSAMPLIAENVRTACRDPENGSAREKLMLAAAQAGMAFSNASVALVHGMSRPIGAHFHVAHGLSNAMLLPAVTEFSVQGSEDRYADCARAMKWADKSDDSLTACRKLVDGLKKLNSDLKVPSPSEYGIDRDAWFSSLEMMAGQALASGSPQNNPRVPDIRQIVELYEKIW